MPELQIDGITICEIDPQSADHLKVLANRRRTDSVHFNGMDFYVLGPAYENVQLLSGMTKVRVDEGLEVDVTIRLKGHVFDPKPD